MKSYYFVIFFCILSLPLFANTSQIATSENIKLLSTKALIEKTEYIQRYQKEIDYIPYIKELQSRLIEDDNSYFNTYTEYLIGGYYLNFYNADKSFQHLNMAVTMSKYLKDSQEENLLKLKIYLALGAFYYELSDISKTLEFQYKAEEINRKVKNQEYALFYTNNMGALYAALGEAEKAIVQYKKALKIPLKISQENINATEAIYANIGNSFLSLHQTDSALFYLNKALYACNDIPTTRTLSILSNIYVNKGEYSVAQKYLEEAITKASLNNKPRNIASYCVKMSNILLQKGEYPQALTYAQKALEIARKLELLEVYSDVYRIESEIYRKQAKYKLASDAQEKYIKLYGSLNERRNISQTQQLILQNEFKLRQQEVEFEFLEKQRENTYHASRMQLIFVFLIFTLTFIVLITLLLLKKKSVTVKNKELIEKSLHDEIDLKNRELSSNIMFQMSKNEILKEIINDLVELKQDLSERNQAKIKPLIKKFQNTTSQDLWSEFDYRFNQVHPTFYKNLLEAHPNLTFNERRLCVFLKLNLTTKEIAQIYNIDPNSVRVARVRLRKKLGLTNDEQEMLQFLSKF